MTAPVIQCKDIQLCYDMAKETRTPIEFLGRMQQIYHRAQYQVSGNISFIWKIGCVNCNRACGDRNCETF